MNNKMTKRIVAFIGVATLTLPSMVFAKDGALTKTQQVAIVQEINDNYDIPAQNEALVKKALSRVGTGIYSVERRMDKGFYDTSSFVARTLKASGNDFVFDGNTAPTAAGMAEKLEKAGYTYTDKTPTPGDLIFFASRTAPDRYKGIGHVAIYLGNIDGQDKMIDMSSTKYPVLIRDYADNGILFARVPTADKE